MASLNVKDPVVRELAMKLAKLRGTTATGAIRDALTEALARESRPREGMAERLLAVGRAAAPHADTFLSDDELYDASGLPK